MEVKEQTLINTGLFLCIGSFSKNGKTSSENNDYIRHNSTISTYALSRDLSIPPIAGVCAALQIKAFAKWKHCIKKIKKYKYEKYDDILERYWKSIAKFQGIKGQNYDCNKFSNNKAIIMLSLKYPQINLGFSWIIRLRCGYKYNTTIAIKMGRVSEDSTNLLNIWIFKCDALASFRWNSLNFIDDLYVLFLRKIRVFNPLSSYDSISIFEDYINHHIYLFLLGGTLVLNELHFDSGEQRQLNELLFKGSSELPVPKDSMPIISSSFELLFDRYCKIPNLSKSVNVILIRHNENTGSASISTKDESRPSSSINYESGESLVDTTLSILKMLLLALDEFDTGEQGHLSEQLQSSSQGSTVPYIVGFAQYLVNIISIVSSSLVLLFERFSINTFITKSADVLPIWQRNSAVRSAVNSHQYTFTNSTIPNTEPIIMDTTLSISKTDFYTKIILHTIVKSVVVETMRQRRNSDTDSNDNFYPHGVIINEWEELETISSSKLINYNSVIAIRSDRVSENYPKYRLCCGRSFKWKMATIQYWRIKIFKRTFITDQYQTEMAKENFYY
ncbi:hypothetical protein H8356DRAFT_1382087 [Neocallimastix lanati (nom. inval.)]|nr:hypothetical protein H8356DRAFT_1382087 [Neocallimastix sp. JGI-2020a]